MINTNYWYYGNIRHMCLCVLRLFQNFCISEGKDEKGNEILRRIPCTMMATDKSVAYLLNNATDTVLETVPKMILAISNVNLNNDKISGAPYYPNETSFTEKKFNPDKGNYEYEPGNSYNVTRLNPLPIGLEFKLFVLTTMQDHKLQLFEQIRSLFSPTLEIQTSENPLDWSRVTAITLTGLNWSSKGTTNLDGTALDSMDMTFEVDMNLDMPTIVQKQCMIDQIAENIGDGNSLDDIMSWDLNDVTTIYHSPSRNSVNLYLDEKTGKQMIKLNPSPIANNWYDVLRLYNFKFDPFNKKILISCVSDSNSDKKSTIGGTLTINKMSPNIAAFNIDDSLLPETNITAVDDIIDPHDMTEKDLIGKRYLITEDISNCELWGTFLHTDRTPLEEGEKIPANSIIEWTKDGWWLELDPETQKGIWFIRSNASPLNLYTYNNEYKIWTDVINKKYNVGQWRIAEKRI